MGTGKEVGAVCDVAGNEDQAGNKISLREGLAEHPAIDVTSETASGNETKEIRISTNRRGIDRRRRITRRIFVHVVAAALCGRGEFHKRNAVDLSAICVGLLRERGVGLIGY